MLVRFEKYKNLQVEDNVDVEIGARCGFNGMIIHNDGSAKCSRRARVKIGSNFHSGKGCMIRTSDHDFRRGYPYVHGAIAGYEVADVFIGDDVWMGSDVLVMKGVTIGNGVIIQARSVVVSDLPDNAISGGHPCRVFAYRDSDDVAFFNSLGMRYRNKTAPEDQARQFEQRFAEYREQKGDFTKK